jgi:hypothetical protein
MEQIQEIGMLIAPRIFGKEYLWLRHECAMGKLQTSELFECARLAQEIRLEALKIARNKGRDPSTLSMSELLDLCEEVIARPDAIELQKAALRKRGFLPPDGTHESD